MFFFLSEEPEKTPDDLEAVALSGPASNKDLPDAPSQLIPLVRRLDVNEAHNHTMSVPNNVPVPSGKLCGGNRTASDYMCQTKPTVFWSVTLNL